MFGRRKKEDVELILPSVTDSNPMGYMFEKTKLYTLSNDQSITVPSNMTATVYFDYADPLPVPPCSKKNLIKMAKIRADKHGKQFYVLFTRALTPDPKDWGIGKIPLKCDGIGFQIGANGKFGFSICDPRTYIAEVCKGESRVYREQDVVADVQNLIRISATDIVKSLFTEVDTIVVNCTFLCDEYALRLNDHFIKNKSLLKLGIDLNYIDVGHMGIRAEDKMEAQKALLNAMIREREAAQNQNGSARAAVRVEDAAPPPAATEATAPATAETDFPTTAHAVKDAPSPDDTAKEEKPTENKTSDIASETAERPIEAESTAPTAKEKSEVTVPADKAAEAPKPTAEAPGSITAAPAPAAETKAAAKPAAKPAAARPTTARTKPVTGSAKPTAAATSKVNATASAKPAATRKKVKTNPFAAEITGSTLWEPILSDGSENGGGENKDGN